MQRKPEASRAARAGSVRPRRSLQHPGATTITTTTTTTTTITITTTTTTLPLQPLLRRRVAIHEGGEHGIDLALATLCHGDQQSDEGAIAWGQRRQGWVRRQRDFYAPRVAAPRAPRLHEHVQRHSPRRQRIVVPGLLVRRGAGAVVTAAGSWRSRSESRGGREEAERIALKEDGGEKGDGVGVAAVPPAGMAMQHQHLSMGRQFSSGSVFI